MKQHKKSFQTLETKDRFLLSMLVGSWTIDVITSLSPWGKYVGIVKYSSRFTSSNLYSTKALFFCKLCLYVVCFLENLLFRYVCLVICILLWTKEFCPNNLRTSQNTLERNQALHEKCIEFSIFSEKQFSTASPLSSPNNYSNMTSIRCLLWSQETVALKRTITPDYPTCIHS